MRTKGQFNYRYGHISIPAHYKFKFFAQAYAVWHFINTPMHHRAVCSDLNIFDWLAVDTGSRLAAELAKPPFHPRRCQRWTPWRAPCCRWRDLEICVWSSTAKSSTSTWCSSTSCTVTSTSSPRADWDTRTGTKMPLVLLGKRRPVILQICRSFIQL